MPIVASPAVGVDEAVGVHFAADDGLQRGFGSIGHDFGIDTIASLEQTKDDGFTACATPAFAVSLRIFELSDKKTAARRQPFLIRYNQNLSDHTIRLEGMAQTNRYDIALASA